MMRRQELPGEVRITKPSLAAVRARQPTEKMIEGPILHHHEDYVVDARVLGSGQIVESRLVRSCSCPSIGKRPERRSCRACQEAAARKFFQVEGHFLPLLRLRCSAFPSCCTGLRCRGIVQPWPPT